MYSILAYFSASKAIDFLIYGLEEYIGILVISEKSNAIKDSIIKDLGLAATILHGKRGFSDHNQDVLFHLATSSPAFLHEYQVSCLSVFPST